VGERVFVAGARCFEGARGLFGGAADRLVVPGAKALLLSEQVQQEGVLLALAATAYHAAWGSGGATPDLIVGHGALGRLLARLAKSLEPEHPVTVWETNPVRMQGAAGYRVIDPSSDERKDYHSIVDVSGDAGLIDALIGRLAPAGEVVLAGFYHQPLAFDFVPAFLREARIRVAAEWKAADLARVTELVNQGDLPLEGIITHRAEFAQAAQAYDTAFSDPSCVKMILDWSHRA
jgi:3-hydroxyethyl bacteriochlorophyllide a dehydrogenase